MNLYHKKYNRYYGEVGKETNLVDIDGEKLHIGDVVLLTEKYSGIGRLRFVAHDNERDADYIMGAYLASIGIESGGSFSWKKIAGYENFSNGFRLCDIQFE